MTQLEPSYMETEEDARFEEALTYDRTRTERHSSRSTFERQMLSGSLVPPSSGVALTTLLTSVTGGFLARLKRVQVTFVVPKTTTPFAGYFGFMRIPAGMAQQNAEIAFNDAIVLRPTVFVSNTDNATYWNCYLPAVNLTDGGRLTLVGHRSTGTSNACDWVARWIMERTVT